MYMPRMQNSATDIPGRNRNFALVRTRKTSSLRLSSRPTNAASGILWDSAMGVPFLFGGPKNFRTTCGSRFGENSELVRGLKTKRISLVGTFAEKYAFGRDRTFLRLIVFGWRKPYFIGVANVGIPSATFGVARNRSGGIPRLSLFYAHDGGLLRRKPPVRRKEAPVGRKSPNGRTNVKSGMPFSRKIIAPGVVFWARIA